MASKKGVSTVAKPKPVPVVCAEGQTLAEALRAAWDKAHNA
jgi:hypothetical protein